MQGELQQTYQKVSELESEVHEYGTVAKTLEGVAGDRKCFRMIGGVLVERTASEVLPALAERKTQIEAMCVMLRGKMESKAKEIDGFRTKYGIQSRKQQGAAGAHGLEGPAKAGVLV
jgi:prefoldin subunit 2